MEKELLVDAKHRMTKAVEAVKTEFNSVRSGRASVGLLDRIHVDYYGTSTPLKQMANIATPESRLLTIQPFDKTAMKSIEKAIMESDLGLNPSSDGSVIRLPIPALTEDRRRDLVKLVHRLAEDGRVAVRNVRRDCMKDLKELVHEGEVGEDAEKRAEHELQKYTDDHVHEIDELAEAQGSGDPRGLSRRSPASASSSILMASLRTWLARWRLRKTAGVAEPAAGGATCRYLAIIMDGNGRWAQGRGLPVAAGHRAGAKGLRRVLEHALDLGIKEVTVYSFSTENWNRPKDEVEALMQLFVEMIDSQVPDMHERGARVRFVGRREGAPEELVRRIEEAEALTAANTRMTLYIAFSYGGRRELLDAAEGLAAEYAAGYAAEFAAGLERGAGEGEGAPGEAGGARHPSFTDDDLRRHLYAPEMHDPELLIRTSGELRISNFLLWQCAYSELYFSDRYWPDFGPDDLDAALADYAGRQRRFGGRRTAAPGDAAPPAIAAGDAGEGGAS